ncbi:hypothetical protein B0I35DRAFT_440075 [Stachybotrys elegans]|uniref:Endosomal spry domain-containing protein n=1 Tax=Stachybotrys elegans TaxID=80388 RepID=A0A8K0WNH8_9HYPO|nr:hypothetical protein B0I35DRAFT_440075 [Stachybotrys elegans]
MAPAIVRSIQGFIGREGFKVSQVLGSTDGPVETANRLLARNERRNEDPSSGVLDPHDISNVGFFVLFALIGVGFVAGGIWFFFWAKNGGFHFRDNDWDEYKSTVLRRRGPNGTILSNATAPTDLGGGSVYKDVADDDDGRTVITESTALSGITAGASDLGAREKRRRKQEQRDRERRKRRGDKSKEQRRHVGVEGVEDEVAEKEAKEQLRNYRHEKPARVGGLNKESEGSTWDGSTNAASSTVSSELLSNRERTPTTTPTTTPTKQGIRKVYSVAERTAHRENERIRAEARRLRDEGRTVRRDFSFQRGSESALSESLLESGSHVSRSSVSYATSGDTGSDLGTKSYHHPMPELREQRRREREERRARRGGYRRGRGEDPDEI